MEAGEITVYKGEIKTPQYGDMYVLDKNFGKYLFDLKNSFTISS